LFKELSDFGSLTLERQQQIARVGHACATVVDPNVLEKFVAIESSLRGQYAGIEQFNKKILELDPDRSERFQTNELAENVEEATDKVTAIDKETVLAELFEAFSDFKSAPGDLDVVHKLDDLWATYVEHLEEVASQDYSSVFRNWFEMLDFAISNCPPNTLDFGEDGQFSREYFHRIWVEWICEECNESTDQDLLIGVSKGIIDKLHQAGEKYDDLVLKKENKHSEQKTIQIELNEDTRSSALTSAELRKMRRQHNAIGSEIIELQNEIFEVEEDLGDLLLPPGISLDHFNDSSSDEAEGAVPLNTKFSSAVLEQIKAFDAEWLTARSTLSPDQKVDDGQPDDEAAKVEVHEEGYKHKKAGGNLHVADEVEAQNDKPAEPV